MYFYLTTWLLDLTSFSVFIRRIFLQMKIPTHNWNWWFQLVVSCGSNPIHPIGVKQRFVSGLVLYFLCLFANTRGDQYWAQLLLYHSRWLLAFGGFVPEGYPYLESILTGMFTINHPFWDTLTFSSFLLLWISRLYTVSTMDFHTIIFS